MIKWFKRHSLLLKDAFFSTIFCLILTFILAGIVINLSFLNPFKEAFKDFSFTDIYYSEKIHETALPKDIILINIEDRNRFELGLLLESVLAENPKVIGLMQFLGTRKIPLEMRIYRHNFRIRRS